MTLYPAPPERQRISFYEEEIAKRFHSKRVGDHVDIRLGVTITDIGESAVTVEVNSMILPNRELLRFEDAADSADQEVTRMGLKTEPSAGG